MELEENSDFEKNKIMNIFNNIQIEDNEMDEECEKIKILINEQIEDLKSILGSKDSNADFFLEKFLKMSENVKSFKELMEKNKNLKKPLAVVLQENSKLKRQILDSNDREIFKQVIGMSFCYF